eukprot:292792_1
MVNNIVSPFVSKFVCDNVVLDFSELGTKMCVSDFTGLHSVACAHDNNMLYKNLLLVPFVVFNSLHRSTSVHGDAYRIALSNGLQECESGSKDTCHIYCDIENKEESYSFSCGGATECHFHCEEKKCLAGGYLDVYDSTKRLYVDSSGEDCMKGTTVYTPSYGNATFTLSGSKGFKGMNIKSNENAQNVIVNCFADIDAKDDCKEMTINAANANYLEITVAQYLEFASSSVYCPTSSNYSGPNEAPCILNVIKGGIIDDVHIITEQGIPHDFWVNDDDGGTISEFWIQCYDDVWSEYPFTSKSACWNTLQTTQPTIQPIKYITDNPTNNPTSTTSPSAHPSTVPTHEPTSHPITNGPSIHPSKYPTQTPSTARPTLHVNVRTPSPTNHERSVTDHVIMETTHGKKEDMNSSDNSSGMSMDLDVILITVGVLLVGCCICLFLCYWYRKERMWKELRHVVYDQERSVHLGKPLMNDAPLKGQNVIQIFDSYDANNLLVPDGTQNMINSSSLGLQTGNATQTVSFTGIAPEKSHGESISLVDGEAMYLGDGDLALVKEINKEHQTRNGDHEALDEDAFLVTGDEGEIHGVVTPGVDLEMSDHDEENDLATSFTKQSTRGFIE